MGLSRHLCCHSNVMAAPLFVPAAQECTTGDGLVFKPPLLLVCTSLQPFALFAKRLLQTVLFISVQLITSLILEIS